MFFCKFIVQIEIENSFIEMTFSRRNSFYPVYGQKKPEFKIKFESFSETIGEPNYRICKKEKLYFHTIFSYKLIIVQREIFRLSFPIHVIFFHPFFYAFAKKVQIHVLI